MLRQSYLVFLTFAMTVSALPLNINLGAFSPAFVVGDGEISLDGENAGELMETLETGASQSAEAQGVEAASNVQEVDTAVNAAIAKAQADAAAEQAQADQENDNPKGGKIEKNPNVKRGKAPLDAPASKKNRRNNKQQKRSLASFRTALNFANKAQQTAPEVELGTGEEGSGVGIIVNPGVEVPKDSAAAGAKRDVDSADEKVEKRDAGDESEQQGNNQNAQNAQAEAEEDDDKMGITIMAIAEI